MSKNLPPPHEDMRIRRTKKLIWEALLTLLEAYPFASIQVKAICEQAMVHRATFYSHFTDKYALLDYGIQEAIQTVVQEVPWNVSAEGRVTLLCSILEYMRTHQRLFSLLLLNTSTESFSKVLLHCFVMNFEEELVRPENAMKHQAIPPSVLTQFYAGAVLQVLTWWVEQEMRVPTKDLANYLQQLLQPLSEPETRES
jgi:AcrR family transcriptional regulator